MIKTLISEFSEIAGEGDLRGIALRHGLRLADARSHSDQNVLGVFVGRFDKQPVKIIHRLASDGHRTEGSGQLNLVQLEVDGHVIEEKAYRGTY